MKVVAIIFGVFLVAVCGVLVYAATRPDVFQVRRTASIKAPPEKIFPLIADFKSWTAWSPYEKKDPAMKRSYGAVTAGKGATYAWEGDKNVGQGSMEVVESGPRKLLMKLDFLKPFEAHNTAEFTLTPRGSTTDVTWAMHGPNLFIGKVMSLFVSMDRMVGKDFETGLANLKAEAER